MRSRPGIVMVGTDLRSPGGITAVVQSYVDGGLFARWKVTFLASYHRAGVLNKLGTALSALLRFAGWLLAGRVALVHAHVAARGSFWRKSAFLVLGMVAGARTVFHLHDGSFPAWYAQRSRGTQWCVRWMLRHCDRVAVLTPGWQLAVRELEPRARTVVLRNPVMVPEKAADPVAQEVLFLARLWPEKGVFDLIEAFAKVAPDFPAARLVCAGDGDLVAVQQLARERGVGDVVSFPGWVAGASKDALLARAGVFVLPSYFEGLPVGVLEAMATGVPVIATRVGGVAEALGDEAGILVEAGDVEALARALASLLASVADRRRMGAAGRARASAVFGRDLVLDAVDGLWRDLGLTAATAQHAAARQMKGR